MCERARANLRKPEAVTLLASFLVDQHLRSIGSSTSQVEIDDMESKVLGHFQPVLTIYLRLLEHAICGCRGRARKNVIWNIHVLLCVGQQFTSTSGEVTLISADSAVVEFARGTVAQDYLHGLDAYFAALVNLPPSRVELNAES